MMDNLTPNKSCVPCQSWVDHSGWSICSTQGPLLSPLPSSQHLSLGSPSDQRPYGHLQASSQNCMSDLGTVSPRNDAHHSALYKAAHIGCSPPSSALFANAAVPHASHIIPFAQQSPHTSSLLLSANQGKNRPPPPLPQANQPLQPCRSQHLPILSPHDLYKVPYQPSLTNQGLQNGLQGLPSCGQHVRTPQATFEGENVEFAGVSGYTRNQGSSTCQRQWTPSSHCRVAANESIPDAAAHLNKDPSQEGNTTPPASERQRSVLLHQREQLLQQLAELDKVLESIPPDDSSNGQQQMSQHTSIQSAPLMDEPAPCEQNKTSDAQQVQLSAGKSKSQSHLSADCSSPASCDKQSETCDTPEDPLSAAESVKNESVSAESEDDSDPNYLPNSDGDFSDFLNDSDGGSSDESSRSSPPTPTDTRPSLPETKMAKSRSSFCKAKTVSPPKKTRAANQKTSSETLVLPCSQSKAKRVYDRRNYCVFCSKPISKMARHLETVHSDKIEVAAAFQYPKNSKERQKIWNRLTNQGNFAHNKNVLKTGKGQLAYRKRPKQAGQVQNFLHCLYCRGLFMRKALHRHMRRCPEKVKNEKESAIGRKRIALQCVLETSDDLDVTDGFKSILSQMIYDDVTQTIMEDTVILQFGELLFNQHGFNVKKHDYIRQNLRQIARLVLEAQKMTPLKKLEDFFLPSSFPYVVSAVNVLAGYDPENKTYGIPSLAIKLGYHLQKTCSIVEGNAVKSGDQSLAESARHFLSVYQRKWNKLISAGALTTLRETKLNTEKKVPFAQDVKCLNFHLENVHLLAERKLRESPSAQSYAALAKVILARTILFNRRRAGEVSTMQLTAFMSRKMSSLHVGMETSVSDLERTMCGFFTRVDIRGKCGRMVPILLKPSFVSALELLVNIRETCGVPSKNPFLFGRPNALSAYNGSECIQKYVKACGAKNPEALTSTKIREHYATMLQMMNLDENEATQILGPDNQVRTLRQDSGVQLDDVNMDSDERPQAASWDHSSRHGQANGAITNDNVTDPPRSANASKKGSQNNAKHKWEEAEVLAVERHLMRLIQGHKVPQKSDCIQCLEAEPEALRTRSWKGVKDYVRNRITALKRQRGSSRATST